jgi:DNA-binding transcriptional ArsR family regulator
VTQDTGPVIRVGLSLARELSNNGVVKNVSKASERKAALAAAPSAVPAHTAPAGPAHMAPAADGGETQHGTRNKVARSILDHGPSTAADLAERLELTPAAVRRHLDALVAEGIAEPREILRRATAWSAAAVLMPAAGEISPRYQELQDQLIVTWKETR